MHHQLSEVIDRACMRGLLKYNTQSDLTHAPFSLNPFSIPESFLSNLVSLTPHFNRLMLHVAQDHDFLCHHLEQTACADPFVRQLIALIPSAINQEYQLLINRNDFFPVPDARGGVLPKQVELNTMAASFAYLSRCVTELHQELHQDHLLEQKCFHNDPLKSMGQAIALAIKHYDSLSSRMLMVVQADENNRFDQLGMIHHLRKEYGIETIRLTLEQVAEQGSLKQGHLQISGEVIALSYFRAGYIPEDMQHEKSFTGRALIENSSTIKIPDIPMQLAGLKKIQQVLSHPGVLESFISEAVAQTLHESFVNLYALNEWKIAGEQRVKEWAIQNPESLILKPQREGGGHNIFGADIKEVLENLKPSEDHAYVLMEQIKPIIHNATLVVNRHSEKRSCMSEIGCYGVALFDGSDFMLNEHAGTLVRTKSSDQNEGGVCAGYACLNSLSSN